MDGIESLGAVFKNFTATRNMVKQSILIHKKMLWETGTVTNGLKSTARAAKAITQSCLPDRAAWFDTRIALRQMTNCSMIAYPPAGRQKNGAPVRAMREVHFIIVVSTKTSNSLVVF
jgi:hypothetical protein